MLNITSFFTYQNLVTSEAIGEGKHVYEVLIDNVTTIVKIWVNANSLEQVKGYLSRRFVVCIPSHETLTGSTTIKGYRLYSVNPKTKTKAFEDIIVRRVF